MERRDFLHLAATTSALALAGPAIPALAGEDEWARAFRAALAEKPWLLGWLGTQDALLETPALAIEGKWPEALTGTFYRNGPGRHEVGGLRYHHWFDGDGMVQAFRFAGGTVSHRGRIVETAKVKAESEAGRAVRATFGTAFPGMERPPNPDSVNTANISVLWHANRLMALWEAGSPYRLDPDSLETKGRHSWSEATKGLPFSAHPRIDADGTLWNIGYAPAAGVLLVYRIGPDGRLKQVVPIKAAPVPMVHDFVITERHLIAVLPPFAVEPGGGKTVLDSYRWRGDRPARVLILGKADLTKPRRLEMPAHFTFHYGNAWEDGDGVIRMDEARYEDALMIPGAFRDVMRGKSGPDRTLAARQHMMTIDPKSGRISETPVIDTRYSVEFPRADPRLTGRRHRKIATLLGDPAAKTNHPMLNTIARIDVETGSMAGFTYGPDTIPEEHVFVPKPGKTGEDEGWILGTSLDFKAGVTRLSVFDPKTMRDGPLAVASLPYALPLGFHGTFVPA